MENESQCVFFTAKAECFAVSPFLTNKIPEKALLNWVVVSGSGELATYCAIVFLIGWIVGLANAAQGAVESNFAKNRRILTLVFLSLGAVVRNFLAAGLWLSMLSMNIAIIVGVVESDTKKFVEQKLSKKREKYRSDLSHSLETSRENHVVNHYECINRDGIFNQAVQFDCPNTFKVKL